MNKISIIRLLNQNKIDNVLVGGMALNLYKNPRLSYDMDLAVKTIDVDNIIDILYKKNFYLIFRQRPKAKKYLRVKFNRKM